MGAEDAVVSGSVDGVVAVGHGILECPLYLALAMPSCFFGRALAGHGSSFSGIVICSQCTHLSSTR